MTESIASTIYHAARNGNIDGIRVMLRGGADIDAKDDNGNTALSIAAGFGATEAVVELIALGADEEVQNDNGFSALHWACNNWPETVRTLVDAGADLESLDTRGNTPLMHAIRDGSTEAAVILVNAGADVTRRYADGKTIAEEARAGGLQGLADLIDRKAEEIAAAERKAEAAERQQGWEQGALSKMRRRNFRKLSR